MENKFRLYNDDCLKILKKMEDNTIDLIITSPPYNYHHDPNNTHNEIVVKYNKYNDNLQQEDYINWQVQVLNECYRVLKDTGLIYYNHKERHRNHEYFHPLEIITKTSFHPLQTIIWRKNGSVMFNTGRWSNNHELIIVAYKTKNYMKISLESEKHFDVWDINRDRNPCMVASFPLELPLRIIKAYEGYDDLTVLDPFMGTGTTFEASTILNRNFVGMEIDKDYFEYAKNRIKQTRLL